MKNQSVVQRKLINNVFWDMFPRSVMLGWGDPEQEVVIVHFFGSDDDRFICIRGVWWEFVSRDTGYYYKTEWEEEWQDCYEIDFLEQVDPPTGVIYSHSNSTSEDTPFSPTNQDQVRSLLYDCLYGWAW